MGCDYYIVKELRIQHENGVEYVNVSKEARYFWGRPDGYDSDDTCEENREKLEEYWYQEYIQKESERDYAKIIYVDGAFVSAKYEETWKRYLINDEYQFPKRDYPEKYSNDLSKIIRVTLIRRVEERYLFSS